MRYKWGLALVLILLLATAYSIEASSKMSQAKAVLRTRSIPASVLGITKLRERMMQLGVLSVEPNPNARYLLESPTPNSQPLGFPTLRSEFGAIAYTVNRDAGKQVLPSTSLMPKDEPIQFPTLSLAIDQFDLKTGPKSLMTHLEKRGRRWERGAFVSYFENGQLRFSSPVGTRIHGGKSRTYLRQKNYRISLRDVYGSKALPVGTVLPEEVGHVTEFIAQADVRHSTSRAGTSHLINPLAYDIVRQIGGYSSRTKPARFYLNGIYQGVYVLTERIDFEYFKKLFGHSDFTFFRERIENKTDALEYGNREDFEALRKWAFNEEHDWTIKNVNSKIDLENFTLSMIANLYCANSDAYQAIVAKDHSKAENKWIWVNWDMDHCFIDVYRSRKHAWRHPTFAQLLGGTTSVRTLVTHRIFSKLIHRSPDYRPYFLETLKKVLNEKLTPEYLNERLTHYEKLAADYGIPRQRYKIIVRDFLEHRHKAVLTQVQKHFKRRGPRKKPNEANVNVAPVS